MAGIMRCSGQFAWYVHVCWRTCGYGVLLQQPRALKSRHFSSLRDVRVTAHLFCAPTIRCEDRCTHIPQRDLSLQHGQHTSKTSHYCPLLSRKEQQLADSNLRSLVNRARNAQVVRQFIGSRPEEVSKKEKDNWSVVLV